MNRFAVALCLAGLAVGIVLVGCETTDQAEDSLTVSPSSVTLQQAVQSVTFTVGPSSGGTTTNVASAVTGGGLQDLSLPLVWSVANSTLGQIGESSGRQAVYIRAARAGINIVMVRDQYNAEGIATVNQTLPATSAGAGSLTLVPSPETIPNGQNQSVITIVATGTAPYTWSIVPGGTAGGSIVGTPNGTTATYQSTTAGSDTVRADDASLPSSWGQVTIYQD